MYVCILENAYTYVHFTGLLENGLHQTHFLNSDGNKHSMISLKVSWAPILLAVIYIYTYIS